MASNDNLRYSAHANSIAKQMIHAILGRSLEGRTLNTHIYTMLELDTLFLSNLVSQLYKLVVVSLVHIREARTGREVFSS